MKVLLVHKFFRYTGGAEVFFFETGRILEQHDHEVAYFSTCHEENEPNAYAGYFVEPPELTQGSLLKRSLQIGRLIYSTGVKARFTKLLDDFQPDVVHVFSIQTYLTPSILVACSERDVPVVMSCNDYKHICPNYKLYHHGQICTRCRRGGFYHAALTRCCKESLIFSAASMLEGYVHRALGVYRHVDRFLFASRFMAQKTEEFWGAGQLEWDMLRNPFDATAIAAGEEFDGPLLYFGRLSNEKGVDVLLRAMQQVPEVPLQIVGDGPDMNSLKALAKGLGLTNVTFSGAVWGEEMDRILAGARGVVVPSVWHENYPYVIVQSFAHGKPVIGSDRGGIPELVLDGQTGLTYPAEDVTALADRIKTLATDEDLSRRLGLMAKEFADAEFNEAKFYQDVMTIYRKVCA